MKTLILTLSLLAFSAVACQSNQTGYTASSGICPCASHWATNTNTNTTTTPPAPSADVSGTVTPEQPNPGETY